MRFSEVSKNRLNARPSGHDQDKRWRIPAAELEVAVLTALRNLLTDNSELSTVLSLGRRTPGDVEAIFASASELAKDLSTASPAELRKMLGLLLQRVDIADACLTITLALGPLGEVLGIAPAQDDDARTYAIVTPIRVTKRGVEQRLIVGEDNEAKVRDVALIRAVARAHTWVDELRSGGCT